MKKEREPEGSECSAVDCMYRIIPDIRFALFFNHKQESANSSELKKAAQEEIQKEKSDQTWTEDQNSEDQNNASQTDGNQNSEDQNNASQTDENQNSEDQAGENQTGENQTDGN